MPSDVGVVEVVLKGVEEVGVEGGTLDLAEDVDGVGVVHLHPHREAPSLLHCVHLLV